MQQSDLVTLLRGQIQARMLEIGPKVGEAKCLEDMLVIIELAIEDRDDLLRKLDKIRPAPTQKNAVRWARALDPADIVKVQELADYFGLDRGSGQRWMNKLVRLEEMEKWGRGQYRQKPTRTGEARLKVVTR